MTMKRRCPHCGNVNQKHLQDNGERPSSLDLWDVNSEAA